jgi:hypothetical protein
MLGSATPAKLRSGEDWTAIVEDEWLTLEARSSATAGEIGSPGLWRGAEPGDAGVRFEIPRQLLAAGRDVDDQHLDALAAVLDWANRSLAGLAAENWQPPDSTEVQAWLRPGALTARCEGLARQGRLVFADRRLGLRFDVARVRPDLSNARRALLQELVGDARRQLRMVRIGFVTDAGNWVQTRESEASALVMELDFSGAPLALLEPLVRFGAEATCLAVQWILAPAALLCDGSPCRLVDGFGVAAKCRGKEFI